MRGTLRAVLVLGLVGCSSAGGTSSSTSGSGSLEVATQPNADRVAARAAIQEGKRLSRLMAARGKRMARPQLQTAANAFMLATPSAKATHTFDSLLSTQDYGPPAINNPRGAALAGQYVAVWEDSTVVPTRIVSGRVDAATGMVQRPWRSAISDESITSWQPAIAPAGDRFLTAFLDDNLQSIRGRWLDGSGQPMGPIFDIGTSSESGLMPSIACTSSRCIVGWHQYTNDGLFQIRAAFVERSSGSITGPFHVTDAATDQYAVSAATDGTSFLLAWSGTTESGDSIRTQLFDGSDHAPVTVSDAPCLYRSLPRATFAGGKYFVSYADGRNMSDADAFVSRVDPSTGALLGETTVASGPGDQDGPAIGAVGSKAKYLFSEYGAMRASDIAADGSASAPQTFAQMDGAFAVDVASTGGNALAFWSGYRYWSYEALGTRLSLADGWSLDQNPISFSAGPGYCSPVSMGASPAGSSSAGADVTFTATSSCVDATAEYQFWIDTPGIGTSLLRDFDSSPTFTWSTLGVPTETYAIRVRARRANMFDNFESEAEVVHSIKGEHGTCSSVSVEASPADGWITAGYPVELTATPSCTDSEAAETQFIGSLSNGVSWTMRDWGGPTFTWQTADFPATNVLITARTRRIGSSATYESQSSFSMFVDGGPDFCPNLEARASASHVALGEGFSVDASGYCTGDAAPEYEFVVKPGNGARQVMRGFSSDPHFSLPATTVGGRYRVWVRARRPGSVLAYEAVAGLTVTVD